MARKQTLSKLLTDLRAETGVSMASSHNIQQRAADINLLQRVQSDLYEDFNWPHLRIERSVRLQAGQRFYSPPEPLNIDKIESISLYADNDWCVLYEGIDISHFYTFNSEKDERSWPPARWRIYEDEQIEMWPIPDQDGDPATLQGMLKFTGIRPLNPLSEDVDFCDLDDRLIVMFAAAERLAVKDKERSQLMFSRATARKMRLQGALVKTEPHKMFGSRPTPPGPFTRIRTYRPASNV